jgi:hypothetical protein
MTKGDKFKELTVDLKKRFRLADPSILHGIDNFLSLIARQELAFAKNNRSGVVYGRYSVMQNFCNIFNPLLIQLISQSRLIDDELKFNDISLPLVKELISSDQCNLYAFKFRNAAAHFDCLAERSHDQNTEFIRCGESLKLIAEILQIILSLIRTESFTWCKFCFRRAVVNFEYCKIHYSTNETIQDTNYRKANRTYKSLDSAVIQMWAKHRSLRSVGEESFLLVADNSPPKEIYQNETALPMSEEKITFVSDTITKSWSEMSSEWNAIIYCFPEISKRFTQSAETYTSWDDFVSALFQALEEPIETTRHPLWAINILKDAEAWFAAEVKFSDRRQNDTLDKVAGLYQNGYSEYEIASKLNLTTKHILQLVREIKKNHSLHKLTKKK